MQNMLAIQNVYKSVQLRVLKLAKATQHSKLLYK